jgi:MFS family permease
LICVFAFFTNCLFFVPVMLPFFRDHIGLGYQGLLLGESAFAASCILFDVPTGWISDIWLRKHTLILGAALDGFGLLLFAFAHTIWHVVVAEMIAGTGICLLNGTHTALLYDSLLSLGRESDYRRLEGRRQAIGLYGVAFAGTIGGFIYATHNFLPIYLSAGAQLIAIIIACNLQEPPRHKRLSEKHPLADIIETVRFVLRGHADIGVIMLSAGILFSATKIIMWSQQPYFLALGLPKYFYGIFMSVGWVLGGLSSQWAHILDGKVDNLRALAVGCAAAILVCLGAGVYLGYPCIALLMFGGSCIFGAISPRVNEALNRGIGSDRRATILSTQSLLNACFFIPVSAVIGWISDSWSIQTALLGLAFWLVVSCGAIFWVRRGDVK